MDLIKEALDKARAAAAKPGREHIDRPPPSQPPASPTARMTPVTAKMSSPTDEAVADGQAGVALGSAARPAGLRPA